MVEISVERKQMIINQNIGVLENTIYDLLLKGKIAKAVNDEAQMKQAEEQALKMNKMLDEYKKELNSLVSIKEEKKEV